jgi:UDP-N-acetylmuramoylalanine--D-glutamate ligase
MIQKFKKYIIYGLGISGIAVAKFLKNKNYEVIATDDNYEVILANSKKYPEINFKKPTEINFDKDSIISFAPGIPLYFPKIHPILKICKDTNATLACDIEILYRENYLNNFFIGITGTNGKSTVTALTGFVFEKLNILSAIGGNIGIPCFEMPQNQNDFVYILETSSYQLDLLSQTKFNIASLLNITPDHIDRHGSLENYINSKKRIFLNQTHQDYCLLNKDDFIVNIILNEFKNDIYFKSNILEMSSSESVKNGVSIIDNIVKINFNDFVFEAKINPLIKGQHNLQNIAFVIAIMSIYYLKKSELNDKNIVKVIKIIEEFKGLKHRLELVKTINNINFINDSKATNAESTEHALKAYENIFWIVGGRAKEGGIDSLQKYFNRIKKAYLIGESSVEFAKILEKNGVNYDLCFDLENAFKNALNDVKKSNLDLNNILLSPACASFDQWKNFEERGNYFCKLVNEI